MTNTTQTASVIFFTEYSVAASIEYFINNKRQPQKISHVVSTTGAVHAINIPNRDVVAIDR